MYGELIPGVLRYPTHAAVFYGFASVAYFCSPPQFQPSGSMDLRIFNYKYYTTLCHTDQLFKNRPNRSFKDKLINSFPGFC